LVQNNSEVKDFDFSQKNCPLCGEKRFKLWGNKKGFTCQKCGYLLTIEEASGFEDSTVAWATDTWVRIKENKK